MKILVVSAHPDDMELACAGHLLKLQSQGAEIVSVITVKPSAEVNSARSKDIVEQELINSYQLSKFKLRIFDTPLHQNGRPNLIVDNNTMTKLSALIDSCDLAIIPDPEDYHQDHRNTFQLSYPLLTSRAREIWTTSSIPYCYHHSTVSSITSDISCHWETKRKLLECYASYMSEEVICKVQISNQYWAGKINAEYAEQFKCIHRHV